MHSNYYTKLGKRPFDLFFTLLGLVLALPFCAVIALLVRVTLGSPVIFCQKRIGHRGRVFVLYKFRTMTDARDSKGNLLPDGQRLTRVGRFLRNMSLDELPELVNVLKGDMSLVGPRPLLVKYLDYYTPEQARRHEVRPGITGWAAINGRNGQSWESIFTNDVWYVDHVGLVSDIRILIRTVLVVLQRKGIYRTDDGFTPEFTGTAKSQ